MSWYNHPGCSCCGGPFNGGNCPGCNSLESKNEFVYDQIRILSIILPTFLTNLHRTSTRKILVFNIKDAFGNKQCKPEDIQELFRKISNDVQNIHEELAEYINTLSWNRHAFYNHGEDDDEDYTIAITPDFWITDSLIMGDDHLDTIPDKESDEFIKSSVENLVPNLSSSIISYPKFNSLLEEFFGELDHIDLIPPGINEANFDPEEEIRLDERLLYDNSSPRPPEDFNSKNSNVIIESFSPSPILVEDNDPFMEEIDLFLAYNGSISQKDSFTMILFPFRTFLTPQMSFEFFFPSSPIR
nr:hypothetical protein [Tanacetum cinerariifolium]